MRAGPRGADNCAIGGFFRIVLPQLALVIVSTIQDSRASTIVVAPIFGALADVLRSRFWHVAPVEAFVTSDAPGG